MLCLSERKISAGISEYQIFKLTIIRIGIGLKKKKTTSTKNVSTWASL